MNKIIALALAFALPGCYAAHAPDPGQDPDACAVEWVCSGVLADDGVCEGLMIAIDPCHAAPEDVPEPCPGTWERVGGAFVYAPGAC